MVPDSIDEYSCHNSKAAPKSYTEEGESSEAGVEAVDPLEDDWESVKEAEYDREVEAGVQAEEEDNRLGEQHLDGPKECNSEYEFEGC